MLKPPARLKEVKRKKKRKKKKDCWNEEGKKVNKLRRLL